MVLPPQTGRQCYIGCGMSEASTRLGFVHRWELPLDPLPQPLLQRARALPKEFELQQATLMCGIICMSDSMLGLRAGRY
jgi:hypothetical protein